MKITDLKISPKSIDELTIFTKNIIYLRNKNNLSKKEMAKLIGIGTGSLNKLEKGEIPERMSVEVVFEICNAFGLHPCDLFRDIEQNHID